MAKQVDWELIERQYRAGQMTLRAIAEGQGYEPGSEPARLRITHQSIANMAKRKGWTRDLSAQARQTARAMFLSDEALPDEDREAIDQAALKQVDILRAHRATIRKLSGFVDRTSTVLEKIIEKLEKQVFPDSALIGKVSDLIDSLSRATKRLVELERATYSLDDPQTAANEGNDHDVTAVISRARSAEERAADIIRLFQGGAGPAA